MNILILILYYHFYTKHQSMSVSKQKDIRKSIALQLEKNLAELKALLGDKKFSRRIKKASKLLTDGIYKSEETAKEPKVKKTIVPAFDKLPAAKKAAPAAISADTKTVAKSPVKKAAVKKSVAKATAAVKTAAPKKQAAKKQAKAK